MNTHFKDLIEYCNATYAAYLAKEGKGRIDKDLAIVLQKIQFEVRQELLQIMVQKTQCKDKLSAIANPCFVGYGNPNSKVLIIGSELPLNYYNKESFLQKSICNTYYWEEILTNEEVSLISDPRNPFSNSQLIEDPELQNYLIIAKQLQPSTENRGFIENCFITYMNHIPYEHTSGNNPITEIRKEVLSHQFFKNFDFIINTASFYNSFRFSEEVFGVKHRNNIIIGENENARVCQYFEGEKSNYILTSPINASNGWTPKTIKQLTQFLLASKRLVYTSAEGLETIKREQN